MVRMPGYCRWRLLVEFLEEADGLQVFAAAEFVGQPVALLAAVVEVQHRGDGIDAQAVDVVLVQPEQGVGNEEVADFVPAVVEDQACPSRGVRRGAGSACSYSAVPSNCRRP